jgi:PPK2 family polyphosphate:nucleotide phosphotransferase
MKLPKLKSQFLIKPHTRVRLSRLSTEIHDGPKSEEAAAPTVVKHRDRLTKLQDVFYASQECALLIVLQGMDTSGKDGTIKHIFSGINPQGCTVAAFKVPTPLEARHDFLWRVHSAVPPRGMIGIFNRSHYEDVLYPVVHKQVSRKVTRARLEDINEFEAELADNNVVILKFLLHISHEEQTRRLQARIDNPNKHWKLSAADFAERKFWPQYQQAYEDAIAATSHKHAPWFVIPSDHKWQRDVAISGIVVEAMDRLKLKYPAPSILPSEIKL